MGADRTVAGGRIVRRAQATSTGGDTRGCEECVHARSYGPRACAFCTHQAGLRAGQTLMGHQTACTLFAPRA